MGKRISSLCAAIALAVAAQNIWAEDSSVLSNAPSPSSASEEAQVRDESLFTAVQNEPSPFDGETVAVEEAQLPPEKPFKVEYAGGLINMDVKDEAFGDVLKNIGSQAGFDIMLAKEVSEKKISTSFSGVGLERAITRLFSLIREKNYKISYASEGAISVIEAMGMAAPAPEETKKGMPVAPGFIQTRPKAVAPAPLVVGPKPESASGMKGVTILQPGAKEGEKEGGGSESGERFPYIPPKEAPVYIPPGGDTSR